MPTQRWTALQLAVRVRVRLTPILTLTRVGRVRIGAYRCAQTWKCGEARHAASSPEKSSWMSDSCMVGARRRGGERERQKKRTSAVAGLREGT